LLFRNSNEKIYRRIAVRFLCYYKIVLLFKSFGELRMKSLSVIMSALVSLGAIGVAEAAMLQPLRGNVRISHGGGYLAVRAATNVDPGDQVMVGPKGQARVVYPDGCAVDVNPGSVMVIGAESPCTRQAAAGFPVDGALVAAGALGAAGGGIAAGVSHTGQISAPFFVPFQPVSP
jgi:hypothetical protein